MDEQAIGGVLRVRPGVAGDEINLLPSDWNFQIAYRGPVRIVNFENGDDARALLHDLGLFELSERVWLRLSQAESSQNPSPLMARYAAA